MLDQPEEILAALAQALSELRGEPAFVDGLARFHGGAARETYGFSAHYHGRTERLVLRRDPASSLITTSRDCEFAMLARCHAAGLPVPEPVLLDPDGSKFGRPGFLMREVAGGRAPSLFDADPYGADRARTGGDLFGLLGALHGLQPTAQDKAVLPTMDAAARLAHWKADIVANAMQPEPVAQAAIRWLEARVPPPSGPPALIHGDFRSGNFLVGGDNRLLAMLDWEMAHIGDPMEDLAWVMDPLWGHGMDGLVAATLPQDRAIAIWEQASGRQFAFEHLAWWRIYAGVMGLAIWIASAAQIVRMKTVDPVMVFAGVYPYRFHNAEVARMLVEQVP